MAVTMQEFLFNPGREISAVELCQLWRETVIAVTARCQRPPWDAGLPEWLLPGRVRAALGIALSKSRATGERGALSGPDRLLTAFDLLFQCQGRITSRRELPKPFAPAVSAQHDTDTLMISCSLFGIAGDRAQTVAQALVRSLDYGLSLGAWSSGAIEVLDCSSHTAAPHIQPTVGAAAMLEFRTPVCQRRDNRLQLDCHTLMTGLGERLSGLARWHGCLLREDWQRIKEVSANLSCDASHLYPVTASKYSHQQDRSMEIGGFLGHLVYGGAGLPELAPLLALGERSCAGKNTTGGQGRYRLLWSES